MSLYREEYFTILRLLQVKLRDADPEAVEIVDRAAALGELDVALADYPKSAVIRYPGCVDEGDVATFGRQERRHFGTGESLY